MLGDIMLRLRALFARERVDRDIDEELRFHLEREADKHVARGMSRADAERRANLELGGASQARDAYRDALGVRLVETIAFDFKLAVSRLRKDARVSAAAVLALGLGIAAATLAFSLLDNLLWSPFPYKDADRLVTFSIRNLTTHGASVGRAFFSGAELRAFREENHTFDDFVASTDSRRVSFVNGGVRRILRGPFVSTNAFSFYGVAPLIGRGLTSGDAEPSAAPVFVASDRMWRTELAADPLALGRTFTVNDTPRTLVGVMPPRFQVGGGDLWLPADAAQVRNFSGGTFGLVGRLKSGVSIPEAAADLDVIAHRFTRNEPGFVLNPAQYAVVVRTLADVSLGNFKSALYALAAAALMLLTIACANVANLLLVRASAREREMAICAALGATRARLVRQLLSEGILLSALGCACGCIGAWEGLRVLAATVPRDTIPAEAVISLNGVALGCAVMLAALTAIVCGLAPALHVTPRDLQSRLASGAKGVAGGLSRGRLRSGLVVLEVALSMVLLVGAALMLRNFFLLTHESLPFEPSRTLYATVVLPTPAYYSQPDRKPAFFSALLSRVKALPDVVDATESLMLPPDEGSWTDIAIPGKPHVERWTTDLEMCTEGYFRTLGIQLLTGRLLSDDDILARRHVAVVNRSLARTYFGTEDPIGQKIKFEVFDRTFVDAPHNAYFDVIGVTADFRTRPGRQSYLVRPTAYVPASAAAFGQPLQLLARTTGDPHALLPSVAREVTAVEPGAAVQASGAIADVLDEEFRTPHFESIAAGAFGGVGLVLVAIGVFSVVAYAVSLQTYDIGVRLALGATSGDVLAMVFKRGAALIVAGMSIGAAVGAALVGLLESVLWGLPPTDPWSFAAAAVAVSGVGLVACLLPARRAASIDPLLVLRAD